MSVKIMGLVFDSNLERDKKFILLAYADHADNNGGNIYPSIMTIARKTGYSERQVQRILSVLVTYNIMVRDGRGPAGTYKYSINLHALAAYNAPALPADELADEDLIAGGDIVSPLPVTRGDIPTSGGDINPAQGDKNTPPGVTSMSPESSFNHPLKPSLLTDSGVTHVTPTLEPIYTPIDPQPEPSEMERLWDFAISQLDLQSPHAAKRYLEQLTLSHRSDDYLAIVNCPTPEVLAWASSRLKTTLRRLISAHHPVDVEFVLHSPTRK